MVTEKYRRKRASMEFFEYLDGRQVYSADIVALAKTPLLKSVAWYKNDLPVAHICFSIGTAEEESERIVLRYRGEERTPDHSMAVAAGLIKRVEALRKSYGLLELA